MATYIRMISKKLAGFQKSRSVLRATHARHLDELPRARHGGDGNLDQGGLAARKRFPQRDAQFIGTTRSPANGAETFGVFDEVGIGKIAGDKPVTVVFLLDAANISEGAIRKNDSDQGNAVTDGGRQFVASVKKPTIAIDGKHWHIRARVLAAQG